MKVPSAEFRPPAEPLRNTRRGASRPSLVSCLVFAACAAAFALLWIVTTAPLFGYGGAAATCALALVVLYPLFVAPTVQRGAAATALAFALSIPVACLHPFGCSAAARLAPFTTFGWMALLLGIVRSTLLYPQPFARALVTEAGLGCAGVLALLYFHDGGLAGTVFGLWSFWLVQASFCLLPGASPPPDEHSVDPFERAQAAALLVLGRRR